MSTWMIVVAALAILVGAALQRVSGTGVGLVIAPALTLLFGPVHGVLLTNMTTPITAFLIMLTVRQFVEWKHAGWLILWSLPGIAVGAWLVSTLPYGVLTTAIGVIVMIGLSIAAVADRFPPASRRAALVPSAFVGGLFNAVAGIAAPAMVVYSRVTRWDQQRFAATMQPVFMTMGLASLAAKGFSGGFSDVPAGFNVALPILIAAGIVGIGVGIWLDKRVSKAGASRIAMVLAGAGGVLTVVKGIMALVA